MSRRAAVAALESIDGVDFGARANIRLEPFAADYVDWAVKQAGDAVLQSGVVEDGDAGRGIKFNHDVDVAVGPIVAARTRTEQCHMTHPTRPQSRLVLPQPGKNFLSIHRFAIARNVIFLQLAGLDIRRPPSFGGSEASTRFSATGRFGRVTFRERRLHLD